MTPNETPYFEDEQSKLHPGEPIVERDVVHCILFDPKTEKVLCLDLPKFKWHTFVIGGIEKGETPLDAAKREVAEETGYADISLIAEVGKTRSGFYAAHKNENRIANATGLLLRLESDRKIETKEEDTKDHICVWVPKEEVGEYVNLKSQTYIWDKAQGFLN